MKIKRALIVRAPYAGLIVDRNKILEMRSRPTKVRERVGIIEAGTGLIIGETTITSSVDYSKEPEILRSKGMIDLHCVPSRSHHQLKKWCHGWVCVDSIRYETPRPYKHPKGAVIWVNLEGAA